VLNVVRALVFAVLAFFFRTRSQLAAEILALRHQLGVLRRSVKRPRLRNVDRGLWTLLSQIWRNWASLRNTAGSCAGLASAGSSLTEVGNDAMLSEILSVAPVSIRDRVTVGAIRSSGSISVGASTPGPLSPFSPVLLPPVPGLPGLVFPPSSGNRTFNPSPSLVPLAPGSYGQVTLNSGAKVALSAGTYYFQTLAFNASSSLIVPSSGTVRIYIASQLSFQGQVVQANGQPGQLFIGYNGTAAVVLAAPFRGTLIAPRALISMGTGNAVQFRGRFFVRSLEVRPRVQLVCDPSVTAR
jgi:hypothetical protein